SGRSASFADLLVEASRQTPPQQPALKEPKDYRLIGTDRVRRKDSLPKATAARSILRTSNCPTCWSR
ncbi:MAG: hypothetical protein ACLGIM_15115, partial [Alphaproteobacteria bacterium]